MLERPTSIEIHSQDEKNSQAIMAKIREGKITDETKIRAMVDSYEFSSSETKQHISDRMIDLLKMGAFNSPPPETIELKAVDTDAHNLYTPLK